MKPRLLRSGLTDSVYIVTRYTERNGHIEAQTKYDASDDFNSLTAGFVNALDLHKARITALQTMLCECGHPEFFQASLHDATCPVYVSPGGGS